MNRKQFLQQVTSFIRTTDAKQHVEKELNQHMLHAKKAWVAKGYDEKDAEIRAVKDMGNPMTLGQSLGKLHKPKVDWLMIGLVGVLLAMSFLPLLAIMNGPVPMFTSYSYMGRNLIYVAFAIIILIGLMLFDIRKLAKGGFVFYGIGIGFLLLLITVPNTFINGEAMFAIGPFKLSVWYVLPIFCVAWAALFSKPSIKLWHALLLTGSAFFFISNIANLPVLFIFSVMSFVMLLQGHFKKKQKMILIIGIVIAIVLFVTMLVFAVRNGNIRPYQLSRLQGFWNPEAYGETSGYLNLLVKEILENAKWFGGIETRMIPEAHTDLVFVSLIQTYGLAVGFVVAGLLLALIARMCVHFIRKPQSFAKLLVVGASTLFATQVLYALAMIIGFVPFTSIQLPFMSYGFMPTVLNACLIGLVLSVYRRKSYIFSDL